MRLLKHATASGPRLASTCEMVHDVRELIAFCSNV